MAEADQLVRFALGPDGRLLQGRTLGGRGAWLCREPGTMGLRLDCALAARKRNAFSRALRRPVTGEQVDGLLTTCAGRARIEGAGGSHEHPTTKGLT